MSRTYLQHLLFDIHTLIGKITGELCDTDSSTDRKYYIVTILCWVRCHELRKNI